MRKKILKLTVISLLTCTIVSSAISSQSSFLYSVRAQKNPNFDQSNLMEYSDAKSVTVSNLLTKEIYLKNSETNLYIALRVEKNISLLGIGLLFDVDHDQIYADDAKILFANNSLKDGYFSLNSVFTQQSQAYFTGKVSDVFYLDRDCTFYQFSIPFNPNSFPNIDMYISDPTDYLLGFDFIEIMNNHLYSWTRGDLDPINSIYNLNSSASSFYTMVLAGPGKYAVPDFNPQTVTQTQTQGATQTSAASSSSYNPDAAATYSSETGMAASPGFELIFPLIVLVTVVSVKKIHLRRLK